MLVYLFAVHTLAVAVATLITSRHTAAAVTAFIATIAALGTGYTIHPEVRTALEVESVNVPVD